MADDLKSERWVGRIGRSLGRCSQGAEKEEELPKFLVRTLNSKVPTGKNPTSKYPLEFDFHLIDLEKKDVEFKYLPTISNGARLGSLGKLDSTIYLLSSSISNWSWRLNQEDNINHNHEQYIHMGSSKIDVSMAIKCWEPFELPYLTPFYSNPATLSGKMYCFGTPRFHPKVFNPGPGQSWKDVVLPPELELDGGGCTVSSPVLPDPVNNRFLVHLSDLRHLYAFYPPKDQDEHKDERRSSGKWECLVSCLKTWYSAAAVADNIIYFHDWDMPTLISAYEISTQKWLQVVEDFSRVGGTVRPFSTMFTLPGNDVICLATGLPSTLTTPAASAHFLRLRVKRTSDIELKLTAIDYQSYDIPSTIKAYDFLML